MKFEVVYKNGKPDGTYRSYYENGQLKGEVVFRDGRIGGMSKVYDEKRKSEAVEKKREALAS